MQETVQKYEKPNPKNFTLPIIKGKRMENMMPKGCALVLEGGGTRGFYTAGVFEALMEKGIMFPYIIGVSAGAANTLTYLAGQLRRNRLIVEHYVHKHEYLSYRNLMKHGSLFGFDFIFETIPKQHIYFDQEVFDSHDVRFLIGATDCNTGEAVWFDKSHINETDAFIAARASCSVPLVSKIVKYKGYDLLDGGIAQPIPIEKSIADGNDFHVIILTRNKGYVKEAFKQKTVLKLMYRKYPKLTEAILERHNNYNKQLAICEKLEKEGKAIIIRPLEPLTVDRTATDTEKLLQLYDEGEREGRELVRLLEEKFF